MALCIMLITGDFHFKIGKKVGLATTLQKAATSAASKTYRRRIQHIPPSKGVPKTRKNGSPVPKPSNCITAILHTGALRIFPPCKGVPERQENGSPLQLGNVGNAATGPVAMVRRARRSKGVPETRDFGSPAQKHKGYGRNTGTDTTQTPHRHQ